MKTKVRRLYDIANVLTSLRLIDKVRSGGSSGDSSSSSSSSSSSNRLLLLLLLLLLPLFRSLYERC